MFILKGVNIYPMQIEQVIMTFPEVGQNYCILLENDGIGDVMRVQVEIRDEYFVEDMRCLQGLQKTIAQRLRDEILVTWNWCRATACPAAKARPCACTTTAPRSSLYGRIHRAGLV